MLARSLETAMALIVLIGALILLNAAVFKFGVDSRDGNDWVQHRRP